MGDSHDDGWADATHFSRREKRVAPKERPGGNPFGWVSPWTPFLNDQKEGAAAPSFGIHPHGAAAGREAGRIDKHPGMRYYVAACGINVGGQERYSAPGWSWANLRKAGYQPFASPNLPGRASLDEKRFSFGPCTARFLWQDQRKWGVQTPSGKFLPNRV